MSDQVLEETLDQVNNTETQPEVTTQEQPAAFQEPSSEDTPKEQVQDKELSDKDKNFRELRDKVARIERERDELRAKQQAAQQQAAQQQAAQQQAEEDSDDIGIGDDDLAEGKHLRKQSKEINKMKREMAQYKQQMYEQSAETRLKATYPDFDKVVSADTIKALGETYPELASTINSSPDLYSKAASAYVLIKKFGIYKEDTYGNDRLLAAQNAAKPKSSASVSPQQGESPMSNANAFANGLTADLKKKLYKEMLDAKKRI